MEAEADLLVAAERRAVGRREREERAGGAGVEALRERPGGERAAEAVVAVRGRDADEGDPGAARPVEVELDERAELVALPRHGEAVPAARERARHVGLRARREAALHVEVVDGRGVLGLAVL